MGSKPSADRSLVVIPTYNEKENIERLCQAVLCQGQDVDVLVVDDNSPDGTGEVVQVLGRREPRVRLLSRASKRGLGTAHVAGFQWALARGYARVITMDADFSHPPDRIPAMIEASRRSHVVIGSRYVAGGGHARWPFRRLVLSAVSNWVARAALRLEPRDCTGAFRCFRREALQVIPFGNIRARGYAFQEEMLWQCSGRGWDLAEVPIVFAGRAGGRSKISLTEVAGAVWVIVRLMFTPVGQKRSTGATRY